MKRFVRSVLFFCGALVVAVGCGDDDGAEESDGGPDTTEAEGACEDVCAAATTAGCGIDTDDCSLGCRVVLGQLDAACVSTATTYYQCQLANDEVCGVITTCSAEANAYTACLSS